MYPIDMYLIDLLLIVFKRKRPHITYVTWGFQTPPVGLEPTTLRLTAECSTDWAKEEYLIVRQSSLPSGEYESRTRDLLLARQALSQLS